jgi:hypothetical protein
MSQRCGERHPEVHLPGGISRARALGTKKPPPISHGCRAADQARLAGPGEPDPVPWLARHAADGERRPLLAADGWRAVVVLAIARPGYGRLERRAFGTGPDIRDLSQAPGQHWL